MKIVCAESVLFAREAFGTIGDPIVRPDRAIAPNDLRDADALIIRSKTRADRALLEGSRISLVGTATAGFDHLDTAWLEAKGIAWRVAAGCNANSVAEYVVTALLCLAHRHGWRLEGRTLGVVGIGQVGRRVVRKAEALGLRVLQNDPPRRLAEGAPELVELDALLPHSDIVTLHVPLTDQGPFATRQMADARFFERMKPGATFINTSRGEVVDDVELLLALETGHLAHAVLDVWNNEPRWNAKLAARADIVSPHIAGYSFDGKLAGTEMIYRDACRFFGVPPTWDPAPLCPPPAVSEIAFTPDQGRTEEALWAIVRKVYDIEADDRAMRTGDADETARAARFERLRRHYPDRREFGNTCVHLMSPAPELRRKLEGIGFRCRS